MAGPEETGEQAPPAPEETGQPDGAFIEIDGTKVPVEEVLKGFKGYQEARSEMGRVHEERSTLRKQLDGYKWADEFSREYHTNPSFKRHIDSFYEETDNRQRTPLVEDPRIARLEERLERQDIDRQFDRMRSENLPLTKEMEAKVLETSYTDGIRDMEAVYWKLYGRNLLSEAAKAAVQKTADHIADNRQVYESPPKGKGGPAPKDTSKMTREEREAAALEAVKKIQWS